MSVKKIVRKFVEKHEISCPESIYQQDKVIEDALELIESLIDEVGYLKRDDD